MSAFFKTIGIRYFRLLNNRWPLGSKHVLQRKPQSLCEGAAGDAVAPLMPSVVEVTAPPVNCVYFAVSTHFVYMKWQLQFPVGFVSHCLYSEPVTQDFSLRNRVRCHVPLTVTLSRPSLMSTWSRHKWKNLRCLCWLTMDHCCYLIFLIKVIMDVNTLRTLTLYKYFCEKCNLLVWLFKILWS